MSNSINRNLAGPAETFFAITPSDTVNLPMRPRGLRVITAGTLAVIDVLGVTTSFTLVQNEIFPISPVRILATGTTATVVGLV